MKSIQTLCITASFLLASVPLQAATPRYYVTEGYYGSVTLKASGSCGFRPVTYRNAWMGELYDAANTPVGWGVITANGGDLLVLETDYAPLRYNDNTDIGVGKDISYTSMVGPDLVTFISDHSGCSIRSIVPSTNSRIRIKWDIPRGKDHVQMNANFSGFENSVCQGPPSNKKCQADRFSGAVVFTGNWSKPN